MNRRPALISGSAIAAIAALLAVPAMAQSEAVDEAAAAQAPAEDFVGGDDIIVTAQRRSESLQNTALAVAAVGGGDLQKLGVSDVTGLSKAVPSLIVQPATGTSVGFYLRGIGSLVGNAFTENPIAFNFNQVYVARPAALLGTFYDIERVEVLKGPQGTLYGRNATGGAINVIPKAPRLGEYGADLNFEVGNYDAIRAQAAVNVPLGETVALRVAGQIAHRDGYLSDGYDDEIGQAARGSLLWESGRAKVTLSADYFHQGGKGTGSVLVPSPLAPGAPPVKDRIGSADPISTGALYDAILASALPPPAKADGPLPGIIRPRQDGFVDSEFWGVSANIDYDLDFATLTVIPAYRDSRPNYLSYNSGYYSRVQEVAKQKSLEIRLASNGSGPFQYVLGGYYFDEDQSALNHFLQGAVLSTKFSVDLSNRSSAVFGQATYEILPDFRLVGGVRYSHERKKNRTALTQTGIFAGVPVDPFNNNVPPVFVGGDRKFNKVTWKAGVEWNVTPDNLVYANVATGFKSGGFFVAALDNSFDPEVITAYTFGSKNRFGDLTINLEAFYWDYKDQQVNYIGPTRNLNAAGNVVVGSGLVTTNAGASRIYGAELELNYRVFDQGRFTANLQYLNGKYTDFKYLAASASANPPRTACSATPTADAQFPQTPPATTFLIDCSGRPQINSPKWSLNLGYEHRIPLGASTDLVAGARTKIEASRFLSPEYLPEEKQGAYRTSDLYLTLDKGSWSLTAFVNNVENKTIYAGTSLRPVYPVVFNILRAPRTYGLRAGFEF